ncbi:hypothetical protein PZN02_005755 [Sinorhizobium garamanticum]|uniref:Uncharacterized protein n=1 Tax=Sinorhizobium garamanticum TaxID=680247 RepID=A0ABY8DHL2_9HYPH|nr:hypothetical protein [Sinorhizobium garamanticum]WEX90379.1 hypothetical protein PZN02_005755 [Sinorhizobium garamanticum]
MKYYLRNLTAKERNEATDRHLASAALFLAAPLMLIAALPVIEDVRSALNR